MARKDGPRVIAKRQARGTDDEVYIGRPSKWGNPFSFGPGSSLAEFHVETRKEAIEAHAKWIQTQPHLLADLHELKEKVLVCWCAPQVCHGDTLLRLANPDLVDPPVQESLW